MATTVRERRELRRRTGLDIGAQVAVAVVALPTLAMAVFGVSTWTLLPTFPPPASNESLLVLRHAVTVVLGIGGLMLVPFAAGARALRLMGAGAAVMAAIGHVFAAQVYREFAWSPALSGLAVGCALAALALVAAGLAPGRRR